jgi:hypothetical protein
MGYLRAYFTAFQVTVSAKATVSLLSFFIDKDYQQNQEGPNPILTSSLDGSSAGRGGKGWTERVDRRDGSPPSVPGFPPKVNRYRVAAFLSYGKYIYLGQLDASSRRCGRNNPNEPKQRRKWGLFRPASSASSVHIAAGIIKRSSRSVRRYILENELPAVRVGKRAYVVRRCDIQAFIERRSLRCCD